MKIRSAKDEDRKQISKMHYRLYAGVKKKKPVPIEAAKMKNIVLIAQDKRDIVGYVWGNFVQYGLERTGYIQELFVSGRHRNKGIGTKLIKSIMTDFKGLKADTLLISADKKNRKAIDFYKRLGFRSDDCTWLYRAPRYLKKKKK